MANRNPRKNQQAPDALLRSDLKIRKHDQARDSLIFDRRNDRDIRRADPERFRALRGNGKGEIVLTLQRAVREAANEGPGVEVLHDRNAKLAHVRTIRKCAPKLSIAKVICAEDPAAV